MRDGLGLSDDISLFVHFGLLREYKGTLDLARTWAASSPRNCHLHIAGAADRPTTLELLRLVEDLANVTLDLRLLPERELHDLVTAADVAVLPYRAVTTSGSAALSIAAGCPVIVPASPAMLELAGIVGRHWMYLYEATLGPDVLIDGIAALKCERDNRPPVTLPTYADLAVATISLYE